MSLLRKDLIPTQELSFVPTEGKNGGQRGKGKNGGRQGQRGKGKNGGRQGQRGKRGIIQPRAQRRRPKTLRLKPKRQQQPILKLTKAQIDVMEALYAKEDRVVQDAKKRAAEILTKMQESTKLTPAEKKVEAVFLKVKTSFPMGPVWKSYRLMVMAMVLLGYFARGANGLIINDSALVINDTSVSVKSVGVESATSSTIESATVHTDDSGDDDPVAASTAPDSGDDDDPEGGSGGESKETSVTSPQVQLWLDTFGSADLERTNSIVHSMDSRSPLLEYEASLAVDDDGYGSRETVNGYRRTLREIMETDEKAADDARRKHSLSDQVRDTAPWLWYDRPGYPWHDMKLQELYKHYDKILSVFTQNMKSFVVNVGDTQDEHQYMTRLLNPVLSELLVIGTPSNRNVTKVNFLLDIIPNDPVLDRTRRNLKDIRTDEISKMVTATDGGADIHALAQKVKTGLSVQNVVGGAVAKITQMKAEDWWTEYATQTEPHNVTSFQDGFYDAWRTYRPYAIQRLREFINVNFKDLQKNVNPEGPTYGQQLAVRGSDASAMAVGKQTSVETDTFRQFRTMAHELIAYNTAMEMTKQGVNQDTSGTTSGETTRAKNIKDGIVQKMNAVGINPDAIKKIEALSSRELLDFLKDSEQAQFFAGSFHLKMSQSPVDQSIMQYVQQSAMNLKTEFDPRRVHSLTSDDEQNQWVYDQLGSIQDAVTHPLKDQELGALITHDIPISKMVQEIWGAMDHQNLQVLETSRKQLVQAMVRADQLLKNHDENVKEAREEGEATGEANALWKLLKNSLLGLGDVVSGFIQVLSGLVRAALAHPTVPTTLAGVFAVYKLRQKCYNRVTGTLRGYARSAGKKLVRMGGNGDAVVPPRGGRRRSKSKKKTKSPKTQPENPTKSLWSSFTDIFNSWKAKDVELDTMSLAELKTVYRDLRGQLSEINRLRDFDTRSDTSKYPNNISDVIKCIQVARDMLDL